MINFLEQFNNPDHSSVIMNKTMFAAVLSAGLLLFGVVATAFEFVPDAQAVKSKGTYLKDTSTSKKHSNSKVCGMDLCNGLKQASTGLQKGQQSRNQ